MRLWIGLADVAIACAFVFMTAATVAALPPEPLRALIVDGQNNHDWKSTTPVLKRILEESGAFTVEVATSPPEKGDMSGFRPDFAAHDVVIMNYTGDSWTEGTRDSLVRYMENGGGMVVVHAADNAFPEWTEFNRMIALGGWGNRDEKWGPYIRWRNNAFVRDSTPGRGGSHGSQHEYTVIARNKNHPIMKGLPVAWRHAKDELYDRLRGPAENLTVLATAYSDTSTGGTGEHEPMLMVVRYGKGRVFHTVMGHDASSIGCVGFITTFLRGTEWAATGKVKRTAAVPNDFPSKNAARVRKF